MKKNVLSSIVVISFIVYSVYQRVIGITNSQFSLQNTVTEIPIQINNPALIQNTPSPTGVSVNTRVQASVYKDGTFTGKSADAFYGFIQVQAVIANGKITAVKFLQYPSDRSQSIEINSQADPILAQEAIQIQNANVDIVSGATDSSLAFITSLQSALDQAKN